jgi:hypothetical protein
MNRQIALIYQTDTAHLLLRQAQHILQALAEVFDHQLEFKFLNAEHLSAQQIAWQAVDCDGILCGESSENLSHDLLHYMGQEAQLHTQMISLFPFPELQAPNGLSSFLQANWILLESHALQLKSGQKGNTDTAFETHTYSGEQISETIRFAFEQATQRKGKMGLLLPTYRSEVNRLWQDTALEIARHYPSVRLEVINFELLVQKLISAPTDTDVILAPAPQASWLKALLTACSTAANAYASVHIGTVRQLYQPAFCLPDQAEQQVNPLGILNATALMLEQGLNLTQEANILRQACRQVIRSGQLTPDMTPDAACTTIEVCEHITNIIRSDQWIEDTDEEVIFNKSNHLQSLTE